MNNQLRRELKNAKLWYYNFRYSVYFPIVVPSSAVVTCILIVLLFVVPQVQGLVSLQGEINATQARIKTMKDNISYLQVVDPQTVDNDFKTATAALPADKDFVGVLNAIAASAVDGNVSLQDYSFSPASSAVQSIHSVSGKSQTDVSVNGMTPVQVSLVVIGTVDEVNGFIRGIEKRLPLAEVKEAEFNQGKAQVVISFYTRAFPKVKLSNGQTVNVLNATDKKLLQKLRTQNGK